MNRYITAHDRVRHDRVFRRSRRAPPRVSDPPVIGQGPICAREPYLEGVVGGTAEQHGFPREEVQVANRAVVRILDHRVQLALLQIPHRQDPGGAWESAQRSATEARVRRTAAVGSSAADVEGPGHRSRVDNNGGQGGAVPPQTSSGSPAPERTAMLVTAPPPASCSKEVTTLS
eukprot:9471157-Pyramimonas_sp.AAC.1